MSDKLSLNIGGGFFGLLTIVLITLKLTGYITISWWWVFAPLLAGILIPFVIIGVLVLLMIIFD